MNPKDTTSTSGEPPSKTAVRKRGPPMIFSRSSRKIRVFFRGRPPETNPKRGNNSRKTQTQIQKKHLKKRRCRRGSEKKKIARLRGPLKAHGAKKAPHHRVQPPCQSKSEGGMWNLDHRRAASLEAPRREKKRKTNSPKGYPQQNTHAQI